MLGSVAEFVFLVQIVTGILLAFNYAPTHSLAEVILYAVRKGVIS